MVSWWFSDIVTPGLCENIIYPIPCLGPYHHAVYNLPDSSSTCLRWPGLPHSFMRSKRGHISQVPSYICTSLHVLTYVCSQICSSEVLNLLMHCVLCVHSYSDKWWYAYVCMYQTDYPRDWLLAHVPVTVSRGELGTYVVVCA